MAKIFVRKNHAIQRNFSNQCSDPDRRSEFHLHLPESRSYHTCTQIPRVAQHRESMRKATRNDDHPFCVSRKNSSKVLSVGFGVWAQINGHIQNISLNSANQFRLRGRTFLKMQTANRPVARA